jgi:DNA-binding response OmpR family regulator
LNRKTYQTRRKANLAQFGEIVLDFRKMELHAAGRPVTLTRLEFKLLRYFVSRPQFVVSREQLLAAVWPKRDHRANTRTVDNHVCKLRRKLERDPAHPAYFQSIFGVGYKFVPPNNFSVDSRDSGNLQRSP